MTSAISDLQPKEVWKHFDALRQIPRPSTKEAAARDYVLGIAKRLGLDVTHDPVGNTVVRKPAHKGRESAPMTLLQGHLDMVCEKNEGTPFNFDTDAIKVVRDGDWIKADGTTLGSDNGIGVSAALAVMESTNIAHGPLEFVFTIDEETGLTGAAEFPGGLLKSKYFLNLDNEEIGTLCIGCAGGVTSKHRTKVALKAPAGNAGFRIKISGLKGGHSGVDIHQGRGNALRVLGRLTQALLKLPVEVAEFKGGSAQNAIPREAFVTVALDASRESELRSIVSRVQEDTQAELGGFDPGLQITVEKANRPDRAIAANDARRVADLLAAIPHGILSMSPDIPGLVQTSTNLAIITTTGDVVEITTSQRSAIASSKNAAADMVATACRLAGFDTELSTGYPGWKPDPHSDIVQALQRAHKKVFGEEGKLIAMHAGLECGVIGEKYPGMQMISFGPTIVDPHSPNERVQISTVDKFWNLLRAALEEV